MLELIGSQVAGFETLRQRHRLAECQSKAFSGDSIHRAGSVTNQSHILSPYALKLEVPSQSASLGRESRGSLQARSQTWQFPQTVLQPETGFVRRQSHADLVRPHAHGIPLAAIAPIDLHVVGPGSDLKVLPECVAHSRLVSRLDAGPAPHLRIYSVRAHNPAGPNVAFPR